MPFGFADHGHDAGGDGITVLVGNLGAYLGGHHAVRFQDAVQVAVEVQPVADPDRPMELELLIAVQHPCDIDGQVHLGEYLVLHSPSGDRQEGDGCDHAGVDLALVLDGRREFAHLLAAHLEVIGVAVVRSDDVLADGHALTHFAAGQ
ncbi:Uncharacterised protein [Mycobacteroides abscessus subsp. abscessus]|nr:Uncharacterised protein [Mycobacteroides abscessus subsp. abscessus]